MRRNGNERREVNAETNAHPSAVTRTRTKTATGRCAKEASGWQRTRPADKHQDAASQHKRVAQPNAVARTRTKTATGGCAKEASGRQRTRPAEQHQTARKSAQRRCTAERSCTDKNQNSNWRMCQRSVGMATNSVGRRASERGKSAQRRCTSERSCTGKNQNSDWQICLRGVGKAMNSASRKASERGKSVKRVAQPSAVARTRTKTATGGCAKEASGKQRTQSVEEHQNARQVSAKALHIRAQLHGQEPKQQLADVPKRRRDGNELGQPKSVRARQVSRMRGENVSVSQHEKKSLILGFYSDPRALNRIRRSPTRRTLTNSIISYL